MFCLTKDLPESIQLALKVRNYNKRDIQVVVKEKESLYCGGGMQGYQSFSDLVNISSGECVKNTGSWGGANAYCLDNHVDLNDNYYTIPKDVAVLKGFHGGASGTTHCTITLSPANVLPLLQASKQTEELSKEELNLLGYFRSYKPAYRKPYIDALGKEGIDKLVNEGYLSRNKAGSLSLTTKGKASAENVRVV